MKVLESMRKALDSIYNDKLWNAIGAALVILATKEILATSVFDNNISWAIAVATGALFFFYPVAAAILQVLVLFMAFAHINGFMIVLIMVVTLALSSTAHPATWAILVMPMAFLPESPILPVAFALLFFGMCMFEKYENSWKTVLFPVLWGLWGFMTCSYGMPNFIYKKKFKYAQAEGTLEEYFDKFDPARGLEILQSRGVQAFLILLAAFLVLGLLAYLIGVKVRIIKTLNHDLLDMVNFLILIVATIGVYFFIKTRSGGEGTLPAGPIIIGGVVGYLISRPWVTSVALEIEQSYGNKEAKGKLAMVNAGETWDSLAGYEETKNELQETIRPYIDKKEYNKLMKANMKPIKGILLYGPPGTGKTTMARIVANETKMNLILVNASQFMSKWVGESEKNLRSVFAQARSKAPAIICFEEIEAFLGKRTKAERSYETSIINVFLTEMDGFKNLKNVLIIATTNNPEMIDEAALRPGRFDKIIYMGAPDPAGSKALFNKYLNGKITPGTVNIDKLVESTERFTGADIKGVCETAFRNNDFKKLTDEDILDVISGTLPSYTLDLQERYERYSKKYSRSTSAQNDNKGKETRKLTWDDIKGMDATKAILKDKIESPIVNAEKYKEYGIPSSKGILLFGPPGCGKTFFAKVAADESNANFYTVNGPELLGAGTGESEANLRRIFRDARETKPSIIFFDEIDAIAGKRDASNGSVRIINQLLTEIDGMDSLNGVMVIAATNRPESLDDALVRSGRFDTKIYIPLPDTASIKELLTSTLDPVPYNLDADLAAKKLDGYTCADIVAIANKAKEIYVKRQIVSGEGNAAPISDADLLGIIDKVKSSVSEEERNRYEALRQYESIL